MPNVSAGALNNVTLLAIHCGVCNANGVFGAGAPSENAIASRFSAEGGTKRESRLQYRHPAISRRGHSEQPRSMSTFVRTEARPPHLTLYVEIALGNRANNLTGIFFPRQYDSASPLNIILYLRGWTPDAVSIDRFWSDARQPQSLLRERINSSGRNLVLVAPTLGTRSEAGWLVHSGGPEAYLDRVIDAVRFHGSAGF
jgi:hypothetical protein